MALAPKLDLHSGLPYWLVINGLLGDFPALKKSLPNEDIVIIGAGISGAFAAHELCRAGFQCTMLDRRLLSSGSTWASTAHLNYEPDTSMSALIRSYGEVSAVRILESGISAVMRVGEVLREADVDAGYEPKNSLYLASDRKGAKQNKTECALRKKHGIPAELIDDVELASVFGISRRNAILHSEAAQLDAYRATAGLIRHHAATGALKVYTRTTVSGLHSDRHGVEIITSGGLRIRARHVVCAPGYESESFLPKRIMDITSTYALATAPIEREQLWKEEALIWETARPYFYLRTTPEGRIIMGGRDEPFQNAKRRDALLHKKEDDLMEQCVALFPKLNGLSADFSWCGTFGETKDGLPYIGEYPGMKGVSFALGYGGNGTTFSMIAAEVIRNQLQGRKDDRAQLFGFGR